MMILNKKYTYNIILKIITLIKLSNPLKFTFNFFKQKYLTIYLNYTILELHKSDILYSFSLFKLHL